MIVFGTRSTNISTKNTNVKCSHCHTEKSVWLYAYQSYVHVFWIPFFPIGKTFVSECSHCKQVLKKNEFGQELQQVAQNLSIIAKTPWWTYLMLILVMGGIILSVIMGILSKS